MFTEQHIYDAVSLVLLAFAAESISLQKTVFFLLNVTYKSAAFSHTNVILIKEWHIEC